MDFHLLFFAWNGFALRLLPRKYHVSVSQWTLPWSNVTKGFQQTWLLGSSTKEMACHRSLQETTDVSLRSDLQQAAWWAAFHWINNAIPIFRELFHQCCGISMLFQVECKPSWQLTTNYILTHRQARLKSPMHISCPPTASTLVLTYPVLYRHMKSTPL